MKSSKGMIALLAFLSAFSTYAATKTRTGPGSSDLNTGSTSGGTYSNPTGSNTSGINPYTTVFSGRGKQISFSLPGNAVFCRNGKYGNYAAIGYRPVNLNRMDPHTASSSNLQK